MAVVGAALGAVLLSLLAVSVPSSTAVLTARVTNSVNTVTTATRFTPATCAETYAASEPATWYRLDETSGSVAADEVGTNDGTYRGNATGGQARACPRDTGSAITLNGSNAYIDNISQFGIPVTYSGEAWFKTTSTRGGFLVGWGAQPTGASATVDRVVYLTNDGRVAFGVNTAAKTAIISPTGYRNGAWHHVMATVGTSGMRLYVDGAQVASSTTQATAVYNGYLRVGHDTLAGWPSAPTSNYLAATLDEVAVYGKTLSATDAAAHHSAGT